MLTFSTRDMVGVCPKSDIVHTHTRESVARILSIDLSFPLKIPLPLIHRHWIRYLLIFFPSSITPKTSGIKPVPPPSFTFQVNKIFQNLHGNVSHHHLYIPLQPPLQNYTVKKDLLKVRSPLQTKFRIRSNIPVFYVAQGQDVTASSSNWFWSITKHFFICSIPLKLHY